MSAQTRTARGRPPTYGDDELQTLQRDTFQYFWQETNPSNGLIPDNTSAGGVPASVVREHRACLLEWHPRSGHYQVSGFGILVVFWPQRCCHNARPRRVPSVGFTRARPGRDPPGARELRELAPEKRLAGARLFRCPTQIAPILLTF